jgi:hypothetical protein
MSILPGFINTFRETFLTRKQLEDAYLAESADIHELEDRMLQLDRRVAEPLQIPTYGLNVR